MLTPTEHIESARRPAQLRALGLLMATIAVMACGGGDSSAPPPSGNAPAPGTAPAPSGNAGQCFDLALLHTNGTRTTVDYEHTGRITGSTTVDSIVNAPATFEGQQSVEHVHRTTGTNTRVLTGEVSNIDLTVKGYARRTGPAEVTVQGAVTSTTIEVQPGVLVPMEVKAVWSPAWVDTQYTLDPGGLLTQTLTSSITTTIGGGQPLVTTTTVSPNVKFHGVETVTVPAGTFSACKFEQFDTASPNTNTFTWLIIGKGILIKSVDQTSEGVQTISATAVRVGL